MLGALPLQETRNAIDPKTEYGMEMEKSPENAVSTHGRSSRPRGGNLDDTTKRLATPHRRRLLPQHHDDDSRHHIAARPQVRDRKISR